MREADTRIAVEKTPWLGVFAGSISNNFKDNDADPKEGWLQVLLFALLRAGIGVGAFAIGVVPNLPDASLCSPRLRAWHA